MYLRLNIGVVFLIGVSLMLMTLGCTKDNTPMSGAYKRSIVVEGYIEQGGYPVVYLTRNIPYYATVDSSDLVYLVLLCYCIAPSLQVAHMRPR